MALVEEFTALGRQWSIWVDSNDAYFVKDDSGAETGPYLTIEEAKIWVQALEQP